MSRLAGTILDGHREQAGVTVADLWLDCFAIGGQLSPDDLRSVLSGTATPNDVDYDVMEHAVQQPASRRPDIAATRGPAAGSQVEDHHRP